MKEYTRLASTPLELAESVYIMRIFEHGMKVRTAPTIHNTQAVDTPYDFKKVVQLMKDLNV